MVPNAAPSLLETAIWSAMAGAIALLLVVALADAVRLRSMRACRGVAFVLLTGASCVLMGGLPQVLLPDLDPHTLLPLKSAAGPLSGALALTYLGLWVGIANEDHLVRWIVTAGGLLLVLAAVVLAALGTQVDADDTYSLLLAAGLVNALSVLCALVVALRAAGLGDPLARWMVLACVCLAGMVLGLYAKGLQIEGAGNLAWALTAACTVAYFLIVTVLTLLRNQMQRRLKRLAQGVVDDAGGLDLPRGSRLVTSVDDALWRSARLRRECVVAAVSVPNLYALGESVGQSLDAQILATLAARIRRVVGFRNVVGLYHPRCFVLVVSAVQDPRRSALLPALLLRSLREPVYFQDQSDDTVFQPAIGIGALRISRFSETALSIMNKAEQLALDASQSEEGIAQQQWPPLAQELQTPGAEAETETGTDAGTASGYARSG